MKAEKDLEQSRKVYKRRVRVTEKTKQKRSVAFMGFTAFFIVSAYLVYYFTTSNEFTLKNYAVTGQVNLNKKSIEGFAEKVIGQNIFLAELDLLAEEVSALGWVESVELKRIFPNTLSINIQERNPYLYLKAGENIRLMDKHAFFIEAENKYKFNLPVVDFTEIDKDVTEEDKKEAFQLLVSFIGKMDKELGLMGYTIDTVKAVDKDNFELKTRRIVKAGKTGNQMSIMINQARIHTDFSYLNKLVADYNKKKKNNPAYIDLRFDKMIVLKG
ncbi:MAG: FtsQ-type POTRA domain-containing protein [Nitrospinae bacterium]|nr:FtsQ-type POTRA domain-containing protein [Nitrospinota bacterium]